MASDLAMLKPIAEHIKMADLLAQLPAYLAAANNAPSQGMSDVAAYTERILNFWRSTSELSMPAWRQAARIIFAISPNSAACERVFAMLDCLFGEEQMSTLADALQASLLLRCNRAKRSKSMLY